MAGLRQQIERREAAMPQTWTLEQQQVIRNLFAKGASDDELAVFQALAIRYDLDPLAREIWCICELDDKGERKLDKNGNPRPPQIQASRAGWRKVAQRDGDCAGIEAGAVYSGDTFSRRPDGSVDHTIALEDRGKLVGAYALVWRHHWTRPAYAWASWIEYGAKQARDADGNLRKYSPWAKYPSAMIEKQAESMALRQAFPLGALAAGDDRDVEHSVAEVAPAPYVAELPAAEPDVPADGEGDEQPADGPQLFPPTQEELDAAAEVDRDDMRDGPEAT
jgi:phage recombination protein Bet